MRAAGANRRPGRSAADEDTVTARDDAVHGFTRFGINLERLVVDALSKLEAPYRFCEVGSFVNVNRHRVDNLHLNIDIDRLFSMGGDVFPIVVK
jgi:hypothetical protein